MKKTNCILIVCCLATSIFSFAQETSLVNSNNEFAFKTYRAFAEQSQNVVLSPFSLYTSMAMVYPGARNNTAVQMQAVLGFPKDLKKHNNAFQVLLDTMKNPDGPLWLSNRVWMNEAARIDKQYQDITSTFFGAPVKPMNFRSDPEQCRSIINHTIQQDTKEEIKEILPPGSISTATSMVLTNAIYFKESWQKPFVEARTMPDTFISGSGQSLERSFMEHDGIFGYFEDDHASILELPYKNWEFTMLIVLPKKSIELVNRNLSADYHASWHLENARFKKIKIPKFSIQQKTDPKAVLSHFGMTDVFNEELADLTGIAPHYHIEDVFHEAVIKVDEKGTTAAAATAVTIEPESIIPNAPDFIANRPFIFILRHLKTNSIIFIGKVEDPSMK